MALPRPGCILRAALVLFGLLFLPMACWFAYTDFHRYKIDAIALFIISIAFLKWGLSRDENSWTAMIDELGGGNTSGGGRGDSRKP